MYEKKGKIIEEFTLGLYPEMFRDHLRDHVNAYLTGRESLDNLLSISEKFTGTNEPIKRLKKILDACSKTVSSTPKVPQPGKKTRPWTVAEDNRLLAGIYKHGMDNWATISKFVGNGRTRPQCSQRWYRALDPKISKETWSEEEDKKLLSLIKEYGDKKWTQIALLMGNRTDVQCRYRNKQLQRKTIGSTISDRQSGSLLFSNQQKTGPILANTSSPEPLHSASEHEISESDEHKAGDRDHTSAPIEEDSFYVESRDTQFFNANIDNLFNFEDDEMFFSLF